MKKMSLFVLMLLLISTDLFSQSFYTGAIGLTQSNGGRTRIFSDNLTTRQIDRTSLLVAVSETQVFDYNEDQDVLENAVTVGTPLFSDFEVTSALNNAYSNLPPNVEARLNLYGWTNGAYLLVKVNITNKEASAVNAIFGLEVIPQVDGAYGSEVIQWDEVSGSVLINKTGWVGYKFFSSPQTALKSIQWVSGYGSDSAYYNWLTQGSFDPPLTADPVDGSVAIFGIAPFTINPNESNTYYYGIALGTDKATCLANLSACEVKYNLIVPVELTSFTAAANGSNIKLSWTTATELNNRGFEIERRTSQSPWATIGFKEGFGTSSETHSYVYTDNVSGLTADKFYYRLKQIDFNGTVSYSSEAEVLNNMAPDHFVLNQNYPNPFNPNTKISFGIPEKSNVILKVFNSIGEEVSLIANGAYEAGTYSFSFDASGLPSGIYLCVLQAGNNIISKKMTLMK